MGKKDYQVKITHLIQTDSLTKEESRIELKPGQDVRELMTPEQKCGIAINIGLGLIQSMLKKNLITANEFKNMSKDFINEMHKQYGLTKKDFVLFKSCGHSIVDLSCQAEA